MLIRSEHFRLCPYSLEMEDPNSGEKTIETYASMPAVIARAAWFIRAGYRIGIWSPLALEQQPRDPIASNDDAREAISELPVFV
jgi:hypothetical protein